MIAEPTMPKGKWVPVAEAALRLRLNRERLIRRIQSGEIDGSRDASGRWFVERKALERAVEGVHATRTLDERAAYAK